MNSPRIVHPPIMISSLAQEVSIIVAPRERLSPVLRSLMSLFRTIPEDVRVVVVEGGSPHGIRSKLTVLQQIRHFEWVSLPYPITPAEARNIGIDRTQTPGIVLADNDIEYEADWLESMVCNALRNNSDVVAPLICIGPPSGSICHHAGGDLIVETEDSETFSVHERHRLMNQPISLVTEETASTDTDVAEFHCLYIKRDFFNRMGPLEERLITREQMDLALRCRSLGARVTFERGAVVTYYAKVQFTPQDLSYHLFRWSHSLAVESLDTFEETWGAKVDRRRILDQWIAQHRIRAIRSAFPRATKRLDDETFRMNFVGKIEQKAWERAHRLRARKIPALSPPQLSSITRLRGLTSRLERKHPIQVSERRLIAGMATMPSRLDTMPQALASILPQVDHLYLYLDSFHAVPDIEDEKVSILRSQDHGSLHAEGKLIGLQWCKKGDAYLTVDDDILYPGDYVRSLNQLYRRHSGRAAVGSHGSYGLFPRMSSYREQRKVISRWRGVETARRVDVLGTDGALFDPSRLTIRPHTWPEANMVDLYFAIECSIRGTERWICARKKDWIKPLGRRQADSIYVQLLKDDTRQTKLAKSLARLENKHWKPQNEAIKIPCLASLQSTDLGNGRLCAMQEDAGWHIPGKDIQ